MVQVEIERTRIDANEKFQFCTLFFEWPTCTYTCVRNCFMLPQFEHRIKCNRTESNKMNTLLLHRIYRAIEHTMQIQYSQFKFHVKNSHWISNWPLKPQTIGKKCTVKVAAFSTLGVAFEFFLLFRRFVRRYL